jgi:hypothetical protein
VIGSSAKEVRAWLVRIGVDEVRTFLLWTVMPVTIPILITTLIACIDVVGIAVFTILSAVEVPTIVCDLVTITARTVEQVICTMLCGDLITTLLAAFLSKVSLEVIDHYIPRVKTLNTKVIAWILSIATITGLRAL